MLLSRQHCFYAGAFVSNKARGRVTYPVVLVDATKDKVALTRHPDAENLAEAKRMMNRLNRQQRITQKTAATILAAAIALHQGGQGRLNLN